MRVIHIQERVRENRVVERLSSTIEGAEVIIGRGGRSNLILSGKLVSLEHAKISLSDNVWRLSDLNSLSGVRVNNARVASAVLSSGDTVLIGDSEFVTSIDPSGLTLLQRLRDVGDGSTGEGAQVLDEHLSIDWYLPRIRTLSLVLSIVILVGWAILPMARGRYDSWSTGALSNSHKMIERDCQKCHAEPFASIQDKECLSCHEMSDHAKNFTSFVSRHSGLDMRCADCHMEHNRGEELISRDSRVCLKCHDGIQQLRPETTLLNVKSLAEHPQFRVSVPQPDGSSKRVSIKDSSVVKDAAPLKLNHAVHLKKGLRGPDGPVDLGCNSCHELDMDKRAIKPISFDKHCRDCHSLGFDERLPDAQLPHGDSEAIYPTLFAEYSKLLLLNKEIARGEESPAARIIPSRDTSLKGRDLSPDAQKVQEAAREAEKEVFTRTGCYLCHNYAEKPIGDQRYDQTRYLITKPNVPTVWLPKAQFDHGAHDNLSCESCHANISKSTETSDLSLPGIETCRDCHVEEERAGYVRSDCAQCHVYHEALEVPANRKQTLSEYLHSLTR